MTRSSKPAAPLEPGPVDVSLAGTLIGLIAFGVVMVYSASAVYAGNMFGNGYHFLVRQTVFASLALVVLALFAQVRIEWLRKSTYPVLLLAVLLMLAVALGLGRSAGGRRAGSPSVQSTCSPQSSPSSPMMIWSAHSLAKKAHRVRSYSIGSCLGFRFTWPIPPVSSLGKPTPPGFRSPRSLICPRLHQLRVPSVRFRCPFLERSDQLNILPVWQLLRLPQHGHILAATICGIRPDRSRGERQIRSPVVVNASRDLEGLTPSPADPASNAVQESEEQPWGSKWRHWLGSGIAWTVCCPLGSVPPGSLDSVDRFRHRCFRAHGGSPLF